MTEKWSLTLCAETRAGGELGHIHDFDSKLLPRLSVDASPHHTEGTPEEHMEKKGNTWLVNKNPLSEQKLAHGGSRNKLRISNTAAMSSVTFQRARQGCRHITFSIPDYVTHLKLRWKLWPWARVWLQRKGDCGLSTYMQPLVYSLWKSSTILQPDNQILCTSLMEIY